jgi:hypothetical protein
MFEILTMACIVNFVLLPYEAYIDVLKNTFEFEILDSHGDDCEDGCLLGRLSTRLRGATPRRQPSS